MLSCARMGSPDGGWYDEQPPQILATTPVDGSVNVSAQKITILFDEYVVLDNATENVIISPPQIETPEIKTKGKSIIVQLYDSLKAETTYTIDFSSAIKDNNEGNVIDNYTYTFSTGEVIDTMQVGGYVLDAETLDPISGIAVGLYLVGDSIEEDSTIVKIFHTVPMLRMARTDSRGHFSVKGVRPGEYRVYALGDLDNNFFLTPNSGEQTAFHGTIVTPSVFDDIRQDTTWLDSLRIKSIARVPYKHYMPDNIILRAFTEQRTTRQLLKNERSDADRIRLLFTYGDSLLPELRLINSDDSTVSRPGADWLMLEHNAKRDTLTYWITDTTLVNTDSLEVELRYRFTYEDSLVTDTLIWQTDTMTFIPKVSYEKRMKQRAEEYEEWLKGERKKQKRGQPYDSIKPPAALDIQLNIKQSLDPDQSVPLEFRTPLAAIDTAAIHLYIKQDTLWFTERFVIQDVADSVEMGPVRRRLQIAAEWEPGAEYSLEFDTLAFVDIYDKWSTPLKQGLKVKSMDEYGTLRVNFTSLAGKTVIAQLMEGGEKIVKELTTTNGVAHFFYLGEKDYFLRIIIDENDNGVWDTGCFDELRQPESVYYYPTSISCRAKWDIVEDWEPTRKPLNEQKPSKLRKSGGGAAQKGGSQQKKVSKNAQRAEKLGIELPDELK